MRTLAPALTLSLLALAAPAASTAMDDGPTVTMAYQAFQPPAVAALAGETVVWHNESVRAHTVSADDGSFGSAVFAGAGYEHRFEAPGTFTYHCSIHPGMNGEVDVYRLLLDAPGTPGAPGEAVDIDGRAALPAGSEVAIEGDSGAGFTRVAGAPVGADGHFTATVRPSTSTSYRAVAGGDESPRVLVRVVDRTVHAAIRRHGGDVVVRARVTPAARGQTVVLQLHLPERFGWWPVRRTRLGHSSRVRFVVHTRRRVRARVLLTAPDGATPLARSGALRAHALR